MSVFRVNPYLQNPSSDGVYITWFTEQDLSSSLTVTGPGLSQPLTLLSNTTFEPALAYTTAEKNQTITGLESGSWLISDNNYKHTVDVRGLLPGQTYTYTVKLGTSTFTSTFKTAPVATDWSSIRFMAMSDSETEPQGRITNREWQPGSFTADSSSRPALSGSQWATRFGTSGAGASQSLRYAMTETEGYRRNLSVVNSRNPDFLLMPGDLVQGGGYQPGWDEFFRHNAGEYDSGLSQYPMLPALGNWENFGALNGGYGTDADGRFGPKFGREKYHVYFDAPDNGTPAHQDNYYRIDYGPITVITLDSSNGEPDDRRSNYGGDGQPPKLTGTEYTASGTDTQDNYTRTQYEAAGGTDLADFNPGSPQWNWTINQLQDARQKGQIIFVQFHHVPYSSGEHGQPMNHALSTGQGGTPMRQYHPLFEQYGVTAVFSGHSEMFERSLVDEDGDGIGVSYFDVGVAGDGLRGQKRTGSGLDKPLLNYNPLSQWTADQSEPEFWQVINGVPQLADGGKHYGHLEVNLERLNPAGGATAKVVLTPVYNFPILDDSYNLVSTERRVYGDEVLLLVNAEGRVTSAPLDPEPLIFGSDQADDLVLDNRQPLKSIFVGDADDVVDASQASYVTAFGGNGTDTLMVASASFAGGGSGDDILVLGTNGIANASILNGGDGSDTLTVIEATGQNMLLGASGIDILRVVEGQDQLLFGGSGNDQLDASSAGGNNRLYGGSGDDTLLSNQGDRLYGGVGDDTLFAGQGGNNLLWGGAGADTFYLMTAGSLPDASNVVKDFEMGLDRFALGGVTAAQVSLLAQNGSTLIRVGEAIVARVEGITPALLNEQNPNQFVFM
jgi:Ca2+-binding RTX toxin-like protein